jgi:hypothetical protein
MNYHDQEPAVADAVFVSCDDCGDNTSAWDWSPSFDRVCLKCLAKQEDYDPRADRGCHEYHQTR